MSAPHSERGNWEWAACGASVTGSHHLRRGLGCDDAYGYALTGDIVAAAVADGAGSVSGTSAWGSYAACQSVLNTVLSADFLAHIRDASETDADAVMQHIFERALIEVGKQAEQLGLPVAQLATTLCVAVATPTLTIFGQIGDGIITSEQHGVIATHLIEEKSEYANTTWFLQSDGAFENAFRTSAHTGVSAFALSTDGMAYKITNIVTGEAYEPFFTGSWQNVRTGVSAADFAALLRSIKDDQTGDDKTMVLTTLDWVPDAFYPSAKPLSTTIVSSPSPAAPSHPQHDTEPASDQPAVPEPPSYQPAATEPDGHSIVDHGLLIEDPATQPLPEQATAGTRRHTRAIDTHAATNNGARPAAEPKRNWRARHRRGQ